VIFIAISLSFSASTLTEAGGTVTWTGRSRPSPIASAPISSYWSEPVNAVTNAAFLIAAASWPGGCAGQRLPLAWALVAVLTAIGVGSYLWHTHATRWAGLMDVLPILVFILIYIFAASTRDFLGLPGTGRGGGAGLLSLCLRSWPAVWAGWCRASARTAPMPAWRC
jgi:hypothetical protein